MLRLYCLPPVAFVDLVEREEEEEEVEKEERTPISMTPIERWLEMTVPFLHLFSGSVSDAFRVMKCCLKKWFLARKHILYAWSLPAKEDSPEFLHFMLRLYCPLQHFSLCSILRICNKLASLLWKTCVVDRKEQTLPAWNHRRVSESANTTIYPQATESASKTSSFETEGFLCVVHGVWKDILLHWQIFLCKLTEGFLRSWSLEGHSPRADFLCKLAFWQALVLRHHGREFQDHHR